MPSSRVSCRIGGILAMNVVVDVSCKKDVQQILYAVIRKSSRVTLGEREKWSDQVSAQKIVKY